MTYYIICFRQVKKYAYHIKMIVQSFLALSVNAWVAVSVDLFSLNPCCTLASVLSLFINDSNLLCINVPKILEKPYKMDIGL